MFTRNYLGVVIFIPTHYQDISTPFSKMLPRGNQIMSAQTANAIMMQQQQNHQQRRFHQHRIGNPNLSGSPGGHPTVIPHNSPNVETQLLCNYSQYLCRRERINGHDFCARHILEDKNAPYKPCNFQYARIHPHRRCPRPAPKTDRKDG